MKGTSEGSHLVVNYAEVAGEKTPSTAKDAGTWKATEDTTVKMAGRTEKRFHLGKEAMVESSLGAVDASKYTAKAGEKGRFTARWSRARKWFTSSRNRGVSPELKLPTRKRNEFDLAVRVHLEQQRKIETRKSRERSTLAD